MDIPENLHPQHISHNGGTPVPSLRGLDESLGFSRLRGKAGKATAPKRCGGQKENQRKTMGKP